MVIGGLPESEVEAAALEVLSEQGWTWKNTHEETFGEQGDFGRDKDEPFLVNRLKAALAKLNPDLPKDALNDAYEQLTRDRSALSLVKANQDLYGLLKEGIEVKVSLDDGGSEIRRAKAIDWLDVENNDFFFAQQFKIAGEVYNRRADLVGFVNGLPLVFIELKAPGHNVKEAFDNNLRDYKNEVPHLFWANGVVLLSNGMDTKVGSITAPWEFFKDWKRVTDEDDTPTVSLETALRGVCAPRRLLDIVENFSVFSEQQAGTVKIVSQNHQFLGVNNAIRAVESIQENKGKLGVFWHTQGSGKSFSMVFFSQKILRKVPGDWTFLILTDREDLDQQIYKTFVGCGAVKAVKGKAKGKATGVQAQSGKHLQTLLTENHRYVFTLIQKFQLSKEERLHRKEYPQLSDRSNIIVIADEAHRSQYDTFARNLRYALPNAAFIGFTGTPLMAGEEQTKETFGDYISIYNFSQAIEDNATVPLYYENRIPELQLSNEDFSEELADIIENADLDPEQAEAVDREFARQYHLITRDDRLEKVAKDIVEHHMGLEGRGKAMVIAIDKVTAVRMYDKVQAAWQRKFEELEAQLAKLTVAQLGVREKLVADIEYMRKMDMAVVVSEAQNEIEDFKEKGLDIAPHRKRMKRKTPVDIDTEFKQDDSNLRMVFVCAMWLTGFDVPSCSTIYLDKPMRNHTLMQTIARANRVYPDKLNGLIVDYVGVFRNLQKALAIYASAKKAGGKGPDTPVAPKEELIEILATTIANTKSFCLKHHVDLDAIHQGTTLERIAKIKDAREALIHPDEVRREFLSFAGRVDRLFKSIGLDERVNEWVHDRGLLRLIANAIRAELPPVDITDVMEQVETLFDKSIDAKGYVIPAPTPMVARESIAEYRVDLSKIDFDALAKFFDKSKSKRSIVNSLQQAAERKLADMMHENPTRRDLYEKLQELIEEYNAGSMTVEQAYEAFQEMLKTLSVEEERHTKEGLSVEELAVYDLLTKPTVSLTKPERKKVKKLAETLLEKLKRDKLVIDWRKKAWRKAGVRTCIYDVLDALPEAYSDEQFEEKCQRVYEHVYESYWGDGTGKYAVA